jgi:hypothetical protein
MNTEPIAESGFGVIHGAKDEEERRARQGRVKSPRRPALLDGLEDWLRERLAPKHPSPRFQGSE